MKEKTITELWVEHAKQRLAHQSKSKYSSKVQFTSENKYMYDFYLCKEVNIVRVFIYLCTGSEEELGYGFEIKDKKVIWKHEDNAEAFFPDDLKEHIEKYVTESNFIYE